MRSKLLLALALSATLFPASISAQGSPAQESRPTVGVAFGGGSARGIAHVGIIRWFEEHHIPIDMAAGTSMGGLIGGAFATGMNSGELDEMLKHLNWDEMFGASNFAFKNIRRKADARAYPSRLEFGLARGIVPPTSLNNGEQVDWLVGRIAGPYYGVTTFDELPTPFRAVAMDVLTATPVVLDRGPLSSAMRATMSLPLIFPPVKLEQWVLVDGGTMDNVPADVVRTMGATRVVAVNVGDLTDRKTIDYSLFAVAGATLDAMMRANTRVAIKGADIIINVPLAEYGSLDWRRSSDLIAAGYGAAESMRDSLLPLAVSDAEYARWQAGRQTRRRTAYPVPAFARVEGFSSSDERHLTRLLDAHIGVPFDLPGFEVDLAELSGLDRYETINWRMVTNDEGGRGMLVKAIPKAYGPPFLMLGLNLGEHHVRGFPGDADRALSPVRRGRIRLRTAPRRNPRLGPGPGHCSDKPLGAGPFFLAPYAGVTTRTFNVIEDDAIVASYSQNLTRAGADVGMNLGRLSDVRAGAYVGRLTADVLVGDPGLPQVKGKEIVAEANWRYDSQDSPVVPSHGTFANTNLRHAFDGPDITPPLPTGRSSVGLTQLAGEATVFKSLSARGRLFFLGGGGTSFGDHPLPTDQFPIGSPFHLGALDYGEIRGDHYYVATGGVPAPARTAA